MNIYQVTNKWTTFKIPINHDDEMYYNKMKEWLEENCVDTYQLFFISYVIIGNCKLTNNDDEYSYSNLLQINLVSATDVMAFKLRWS